MENLDKHQSAALGQRMKECRLRAKLTQSELAEKADIDTNNLSRIERGQTMPMLSTVVKIADALKITPNDLLLFSFDAPIELLDAEMAQMLSGVSREKRKRIMEYIKFIKQQPED